MNKQLFVIALGFFASTSIIISCSDKETVTSSNTSSCNSFEDRLIMKYVDSLNLNPTITEECIYYIKTIESNSDIYPDTNSTVKIHYRVYFLNGYVHDDSYSRGEPSTFPLAEIIEGMKLGIIEMQVGESSTFIIPSKYGWGEEGLGSIPPNEILVIDVDLLEII